MILQADAYDPTESDDRPRVSHISKKDLKWGLLIVLVLVLMLWPVWIRLKMQRDKHVCKDNLSQMAKALQIYALDNSDRLPPAYVAGDNYEPRLFKGRAVSWISLIAPGVRSPGSNFECPAAQPDEMAPNAGPDGTTIMSSYGLFGAVAAAPLANIPNPQWVAMIAETSNGGAQGTYNPSPMKDPAGQIVPDGYIVGFDNSNFLPTDSSIEVYAKSAKATRLAFYETKSGQFKADGVARHPGGIHILFVDMHVETLLPTVAVIKRRGAAGSEIVKTWAVR